MGGKLMNVSSVNVTVEVVRAGEAPEAIRPPVGEWTVQEAAAYAADHAWQFPGGSVIRIEVRTEKALP